MPIINSRQFESGVWREGFEINSAFQFADDAVQKFLNALSRIILSDKGMRVYPDLITFGYFCRKSNIARAVSDVSSFGSRFGWGTVIHIAPGNIPLNFAFSFVMGLLAGNSNIVRLPSQHFLQAELCVALIDQLLADPGFAPLARRIRFVQSDRDSSELDGLIADMAGVVVWGGNDTVTRFRALPKAPRCVEIYFPDRVSSLIVDARGYLALSEEEATLNARRFFNDTFLVDQNACSSPNTIFWLGESADIKNAQSQFWSRLAPILEAEYAIDPMTRINRNLDIFRDVIYLERALKLSMDYDVWRLEDPGLLGLSMRFGTFLEIAVTKIEQVLDYLRPNEQTLTTLGISPEVVFGELRANGRIASVDRIVPVGSALDMSFNWDGKELLSILSRRVHIG